MGNAAAVAVVVTSVLLAGCSSVEPSIADTSTITAAVIVSDTTTTTAAVPPSTTMVERTTTTATTTTAPPLNAEAVVFIEEWAALLNDGDFDGAADMVVAAQEWDASGDSAEDREKSTRTFFEIWTILGSEITIDSCKTLSSGVTRCRVTRTSSDIEPIYPEPETSTLSVRFSDTGDLAYAGTAAIQTDPWWLPYTTFRQWALDTYETGPDSPYTQLFVVIDPADYPRVLEEEVVSWRAATGD